MRDLEDIKLPLSGKDVAEIAANLVTLRERLDATIELMSRATGLDLLAATKSGTRL